MSAKLILAIALCGTAQAGTIVDILGTVSGCNSCSSPSNILPGNTFPTSGLQSPVTQSFGAGTYTFTNGDPWTGTASGRRGDPCADGRTAMRKQADR